MAFPLQKQLFDSFMGSQEGIHSVILPSIFSSGGSKNVFIDKYGRVVRMSGYAKQNSTAMTTDTGASASMVRALIPYRKTGTAVSRKLLIVLDDQVNEWEVWVSSDNGATSSFLYDAGSGSIGQIPDAAQFGDKVYLTNGKVQPRSYDGTSIATTGLTQSPTITSAAGAAGQLNGNYKWKMVSTIAGVRQNGSVASTSLLLQNKQGSLSWTADANGSVDGYEIYRTSGTGTIYYFLTAISGRTTVAFTDNIADTTLLEQRTLAEHGDAPPVAYFCEPHKQRMWWLKTDTYPTRGYWSDVNGPESVYGENYLDFSDSSSIGDEITGGVGNFEGLLVVFTERSIWTVSGSGAAIGNLTDWDKRRTNSTIGAVHGRSVVRVPSGSKFPDQFGSTQTVGRDSLAYFTPLGDIRLFDGFNDIIISHPLRDTIRAFNYEQRKKIWATLDSENDQVFWCFPSGTATEPNTIACWNYRYGVWYKWSTMPFGHGCEVESSTDAAILLTGESLTTKGGYVYAFLSGNSFDDSPIDARWMTKTLYGLGEDGKPLLSNRKRWRWLDVLFHSDSNISMDLAWFAGEASDTDENPVRTASIGTLIVYLVTSDGSQIWTNAGSPITVTITSSQIKTFLTKVNQEYFHDEGIRIRVSSNNTDDPWTLESMNLAYQVLPGLQRRSQ